ncbi:hypothetical protein JQ594_28410 [Bradyrhizobium manausense]|uniref:hypothetical protein n=1 Tax=Bradyrhizobium manausense TaxID=989370 RepID=UPI001BA6D640|nr:hypothetical protein [Bradyrhizobium manausense]MBR0689866.1 hypothetical protein [Bradyrhizobium manausense]
MRSSQLARRPTASQLFISPKCEVAIPIRNLLLRDVLEQASLDPEVRAIRYRQAPNFGAQVALTGVIIDRTDGRFMLAVYASKPRRPPEEFDRLERMLGGIGFRLLELDAHDIKSEPTFSNAREIWSHQRYEVPLRDRLKISAALEEGPQSILELEDRARPSCDILRALCALACEDLVEISITGMPLGTFSIVRARHSV